MSLQAAMSALEHAAARVVDTPPFHLVAQTLSRVGSLAEARAEADDPEITVAGERLALAANLAGAGVAAFGGLTRVGRLPDVVPALLSVATNVPHLRAGIRSWLGPRWSEPVLAGAESLTHALAGEPAGLLVDAVHRAQRLAEAQARTLAWQRQAPRLLADHEPDEPETVSENVVPARPCPLPDGPVEQYAARAATIGAAGLGGSLLLGRTHLSAPAVAAATAKPARLAKESFATRMGRCVAKHDVLINDPLALRRLDRVDTVVIDAGILTTGRWSIEEVVPLAGAADPPALHARALGLLDPADPQRERRRSGWRTGPAGPLEGVAAEQAAAAGVDETALAQRGACRIALFHRDRPVALLWLLPELDPYTEGVLTAAAPVGQVLVAGRGSRLDQRVKIAGLVAGGTHLATSVRTLQEAGHGVLLVAEHGRPGLSAADVGIAVPAKNPGRHPRRQSGHLIATMPDVVQLLTAVPAARRAARSGVRIASYEALAAAVLGLASPARRAGRNALLGSSVAALAGIGAGAWHAEPVVRMRAPRPVDRNPWHAIPVPEVFHRLRSSIRGLDVPQVSQRRRADEDTGPVVTGLAHAVAEELANPLTPVLAAGAGLAAAVGSPLDAALIGGVVLANSVVGGVQRVRADRAVRRLTEHASVPVRLIRGGRHVSVAAEELVPGDVVELRAGDAVPADCRIVEAVGLEMDEANLTGESLPVAKTAKPSTARVPADRISMVYEGTAVAVGHGLAIVVAAGADTEARRAEHGAAIPKSSGVHSRLEELTKSTLPLSVGSGALLLAVNLLRGQPITQAIAPAVSLAVASVPEGLPSVATVAQLAAARRLSARGVLVRNPSTLESLGRVQSLCFDKTGTLTEGRLRLRLVGDGTEEFGGTQLPERMSLVVAAALRATPQQRASQRLPHPTDRAVLAGAEETATSIQYGQSGWQRDGELPFEPRRGLHATLGRVEDQKILSVKGAPETLIGRCTSRLADAGTQPLDDRRRRKLSAAAGRLARRGYRVLAVAENPVPAGYRLSWDTLDQLNFLGFLALADRVRPAAAEAVATLQRAGIRVVMITGDHPSTAESVATELGVLDGGEILTGAQLDEFDDDKLVDVLPRVTVFARTSPAQKVRVVRLLRRAGEVVAVTGDGANDAPAIRAAHVGIALGSRATPAARQAADMVVTDDRIETVVDAIVEGRILWASVRDALSVLLGGNLGEVAFTVGVGIAGGTGINTRQLLLVNMLTDVVPALVLAARPPDSAQPQALLAEGPDASLGTALTRDIRIRAATTAGAAGAAWTVARFTGTQARASTVALVALVAAQLAQTIVAGRFDPAVTAACVGSLALLAVAVQTPGLSHLLGSRPLGPVGWGLGLGAACGAAGVTWLIARRDGDPDVDAEQQDQTEPNPLVRATDAVSAVVAAALGLETPSTDSPAKPATPPE